MILNKDGQGLTGRGGRKGQLAVTGERKGRALRLSEAAFQVLRHMCNDAFQLFPYCNCSPQASKQVMKYLTVPHRYKQGTTDILYLLLQPALSSREMTLSVPSEALQVTQTHVVDSKNLPAFLLEP